MANNFVNSKKTNVPTSLTTVYTPNSGKKSIMIGCMFSNKTGVDVTVDLFIDGNGTAGGSNVSKDDVYLAKGVTVYAGTSLELMEAKIVLQDGDAVQVLCSAATSVDCVISLLEDVA